jgi:hypothetical protein
MKAAFSVVLRVIALSLVLFFSYSVASLMVGLGTPSGSSTAAVIWLFAASLLSSIAISYPVIRSKWYGWRLVLTIFTVFYGITTFLSQIETVVFLEYLVNIIPAEIVPRLFVQGVIVSALFSVSAVLIHGKMSGGKEYGESETEKISPNICLNMPLKVWIWKLSLVAVIYVAIYISFGMLVFRPLAGDAFQEFYAGLQLPAWIVPFQMVRGLVWAALALPVIKMMEGELWEIKLAVALLFSVLMGSLLLIPNPYMPDAIRLAHLIEVTSSNFVFGWIVATVLCWRRGRGG